MKIIGYLLSIIGIATVAYTLDAVKKAVPLAFLDSIPSTTLRIAGIALVGVGLIIILKGGNSGSSNTKDQELPIYEGNKIVGYRRN